MNNDGTKGASILHFLCSIDAPMPNDSFSTNGWFKKEFYKKSV